METLKKILELGLQAKTFAILTVLLAVVSLGSAYTAEYVFGLKPCVLCLYQRIPYFVALVFGLVLLITEYRKSGLPSDENHANSSLVQSLLLTGLFLTFLVGAGIALFHVGVEQKWWQGTASCGAGGALPTSFDDIKAQILNTRPVDCSKVSWSFLGISMAGYNFMLSIGWAVGCLAALLTYLKSNTQEHMSKHETL